jgi:hypothetical protein
VTFRLGGWHHVQGRRFTASPPATRRRATQTEDTMASEKHRGAPKKQVKKPSAAAKAKQAKKLATRAGNAPEPSQS